MSNLNIVIPTFFMCKGEGMGKGVQVSATMTEQINTFGSTNKAHGKLTGVNLVLHHWCNYGRYQLQG